MTYICHIYTYACIYTYTYVYIYDIYMHVIYSKCAIVMQWFFSVSCIESIKYLYGGEK